MAAERLACQSEWVADRSFARPLYLDTLWSYVWMNRVDSEVDVQVELHLLQFVKTLRSSDNVLIPSGEKFLVLALLEGGYQGGLHSS